MDEFIEEGRYATHETLKGYRFTGYGTPFDAVSAPLPVFQHLAFVLKQEQTQPDMSTTIYLKSTI